MKPKDLKYPYRWEERRALVADRVWFIPDYYDRHGEWTFPGFEEASFFGNRAPVWIEYCAGNGLWITEKAAKEPEKNWIAVEWQFERARKIWSKIKNQGLTNLMVVCGEALTFTRFYLPDRSIAGAYVNFPDPWPKGKHAKHRLIQSPFVAELARIIVPAGETTFVTDDADYCAQICSEMGRSPSWSSSFPAPHFVTDWPNYGTSFFDALWRGKGCTIRYMNYVHN